ncbi:hypothetical protein PHYPSEUDO_012391 [Phytophthora pseudosyringae]|uniref:Uncharacterized protein n=1 Tax=Phytophthora pseudosyringae TaxID=221518 RepID=A0A8T1V7L9_9STRA|nr:hypothetical protein PHYPSEUDO_012391 [Phytophthora pseudosyringae]
MCPVRCHHKQIRRKRRDQSSVHARQAMTSHPRQTGTAPEMLVPVQWLPTATHGLSAQPATSRPSIEHPLRAIPIDTAFNLEDFSQSFSPVDRTTAAPSSTQSLSLTEKVDKLFEMFSDLRQALHPVTSA